MKTKVISFKEEVYASCTTALREKINVLTGLLNELSAGAENDSKSTAGNKHETSQAMTHLEQEKIGRQINELFEQKVVLETIDPKINSRKIVKGSLVKTDKGYFFLSIALGKISVNNNETVIALSPQSPLGLKLSEIDIGGSAIINGVNYFIESVV